MALSPVPAGAVVEPIVQNVPTFQVENATKKVLSAGEKSKARTNLRRAARIAAWVMVAAVGIFFLQGTVWLAVFGVYCVRLYFNFKKKRALKGQPKPEKQENLWAILTATLLTLGYPILFLIVVILTAFLEVLTAELAIALLLLLPLLIALFFFIRYLRKYKGYLWLAILTGLLLFFELLLTFILLFLSFTIPPLAVVTLLAVAVLEGFLA